MFLFVLVCAALLALLGVAHAAQAEASSSPAGSLHDDASFAAVHDGTALLASAHVLPAYELGAAEPEDSDQDASVDPADVPFAGRAASAASLAAKVMSPRRGAHVPRQLSSPELARAPPAA